MDAWHHKLIGSSYLNFSFDTMDRPAKRQRKSRNEQPNSRRRPNAIPHSSSPIEITSPFTLSTRPKQPASPSPQKPNASPDKSKSLHGFFQPATEAQRWAKLEKQSPAIDDVDLIEDDYDSYDEIFTQHLANEQTAALSASQTNGKPTSKPPKPKPKAPVKRSTKRFLLSSAKTNVEEPTQSQDRRPWAQRYAPASLASLAVHKKKVSEVKSWLEDVFSGTRPEVCF